MDWDDLKIALEIARQGSLSAAARALGMTQPTISRRLDRFERSLGVKLFERSRDGMTVTAVGAAMADGLRQMEDGALSVERRIAAGDAGLQGPITVTSLDWLGDAVIAPVLARFAARHPLVAIELISKVRLFSLPRREADLAIRFRPFDQDDLLERKIAEVSYGLYASPAFLEQHGNPDFASGCAGQPIVTMHEPAAGAAQVAWLRRLAPAAPVILQTNGVRSQLAAAEAGVAMAALPRVLGDAQPMLRRLETPAPGLVQSVRLGLHPDLRDAPRIRALVDFIVEALRARAHELNPA